MNSIDSAYFLRFGYIYNRNLGIQYGKRLLKTCNKLAGADEKSLLQTPTAVSEEIERLLNQSLTSSVSSEPAPALFLSGGIDSPLIAAIAQSLSTTPLKAFTFSSQDDTADEAEQAARYATELGLEHHIVTLDPKRLPEIIIELISHCDEPPGFYSIIPTYLVCKEAKKHADVILAGDGADELFWGYASRMSPVIRLSPVFRYPKWLRKLRWWLLKRPNEWNLRYFDTVGEWYRSTHEHNFVGWLKQIFPALPSLSGEHNLYDYAGTTQNETAYWVRWNEFSGHMQANLTKTHMAATAADIQMESPFLDQKMIDFAARLDWHTWLDIKNEVGKLPLRALLAKYVSQTPEGKLGFNVPMGAWMRGPLRSIFEEYVLSKDALMGLEINREVMRKHFEDHLSGTMDRSWGLWIFLSLAIWEELHKGRTFND
ncbi:MAG TPA: asparagine synthase C-terminal domain-containing protein [Brevefilum sp.]|nr:asparagine synthase C-terminal domain-containing protein [Brevefilum sp.]HOR20036.1 asparagine synthase C-terminal domain-containing protein [Brevefilum sp.]HPL69856.1 asparagine synthase C-terminal domain-containing protein [Brevefilum sp.]